MSLAVRVTRAHPTRRPRHRLIGPCIAFWTSAGIIQVSHHQIGVRIGCYAGGLKEIARALVTYKLR